MGDELYRLIHALAFRPERRPVWRNRHTGREVVVLDLAVNDHGGFHGGMRQFVVITDEQGPPGPPPPPPAAGVRPLESFLEHFEPTGQWTDQYAWETEPTELERWKYRALKAEQRLGQIRSTFWEFEKALNTHEDGRLIER